MSQPNFATLKLHRGKDQSIRRFHPWIFSGAVHHIEGDVKEGDIVVINDHKDNFLGMAHYANGSICARIFSFLPELPDDRFWEDKFADAIALRKTIGLFDDPSTTMFRLIHGEGDGLPGLIADWYNGVVVFQAHTKGMHNLISHFARAMKKVLGEKLIAIYDKSSKTLAKHGSTSENRYIYGEVAVPHKASEGGLTFEVDWVKGQKTGFFVDQRDNRRLLGAFSKGKKVLNTYCYSGGFSIYALNEGAAMVHSLDSSEIALEWTKANEKHNNFDDSRHQIIQADAMHFLEHSEESYDLIILDPPAFAKHIRTRHNAVKGYMRLNAAAFAILPVGGILFTFSCSQAVDKVLFRNTVTAAALQAGRRVKLLYQLTQPADHPVSLHHPEGEYLKGLVLQVIA